MNDQLKPNPFAVLTKQKGSAKNTLLPVSHWPLKVPETIAQVPADAGSKEVGKNAVDTTTTKVSSTEPSAATPSATAASEAPSPTTETGSKPKLTFAFGGASAALKDKLAGVKGITLPQGAIPTPAQPSKPKPAEDDGMDFSAQLEAVLGNLESGAVSKVPGASGPKDLEINTIVPKAKITADDWTWPGQTDKWTDDEVKLVRDSFITLENSITDKEQVSKSVRNILHITKQNPNLAHILLLPDDIGLMVEGLRRSANVIIHRKETKQKAKAAKNENVADVMAALRDLNFGAAS